MNVKKMIEAQHRLQKEFARSLETSAKSKGKNMAARKPEKTVYVDGGQMEKIVKYARLKKVEKRLKDKLASAREAINQFTPDTKKTVVFVEQTKEGEKKLASYAWQHKGDFTVSAHDERVLRIH